LRRDFFGQILEKMMKTTVIKIVVQTPEHLAINEGVNLDSLKINVNNGKKSLAEMEYSELKELYESQLEELEKQSKHLEFLVEKRLRVEKWNTSPCQELYYVMNDEDVAIAQHQDMSTAIDMAIELIQNEIVDSLGEVP